MKSKLFLVLLGFAVMTLLLEVIGAGVISVPGGSARAAPATTPVQPLVIGTPYAVQEGIDSAVLVFPDYTDVTDDVAAVGELGRQINARGKDGIVVACKEHSASFQLGDVHDCVAIFYFRRAQPK